MLGCIVMTTSYSDPRAVAEAGEAIYKELYQQEYEKTQIGKFVAINILSKKATLGDDPSGTLVAAKNSEPTGVFHLIRVGFPAAFQLSRYQSGSAQNSLFK